MASSALRAPVAFPPLDDVDAGVIQDARRRQHRRQRIAWSLALLLAGAGLAAYLVVTDARHESSHPAPRPSAVLSATAVLATTPYMGVACPDPNTITCDGLGLALHLRHPAVAVQATIAGRTFSLDPDLPHHFHRIDTPNAAARAPAIAFTGYLRPAGLRDRLHVVPDIDATHWIGRDAPSPIVRLRVQRPDGSIVSTNVRVRLSAGWG